MNNRWQYPALTEPLIIPVPETITMDKWFRETQRPPKGPRHFEFLYPTLFYEGYPRFAAVSNVLRDTTDFSEASKSQTDFTKQSSKSTTDFSKSSKETTPFTPVR